MKTRNIIFLTALLLCLLSSTVRSYAAVFTVKADGKNSFVLQLQGISQPHVEIALKDSQGNALHKETIHQTAIDSRKYSLKQLPWGSYILWVKYDNVVQVQPLTRSYNALEINPANLRTLFKPTFRFSDPGIMDVDMLWLSSGKLTIVISDSNGNMLYKEVVKSAMPLHRRFNLRQLEEGNYTIAIKFKDGNLYHDFYEAIDIMSPVAPSDLLM